MFFDIVVLLILAAAAFIGYRYGTSKELYRLAKIFVGLTLAGTYSANLGSFLTSIGLLKANDWAVLSLSGFLLAFVIFWVIAYFIEKLFVRMELHKSLVNRYLGMLSNTIQALLFITFFAFMSTQLSFVKDGYKAYLVENSFSYIYMDRVCRKVVTANFVDSLIKDHSAESTKELLIKTFGDAKILQQITK